MTDDTEWVEVRVDADLCVGVGQCEALAPQVFRVSDDGVGEVVEPGFVEPSIAAAATEACPSGAISFVSGRNDSRGRGIE